jgi:hypothetical protein
MPTMTLDPVATARQFVFVREAGPNRGLRVEAIQHWCSGAPGDSWCMEFATMILDLCFQGAAPIARQGSCEAVHALASQRGWLAPAPSLGDLVLSINPDSGLAHHVGIVSGLVPLQSIAGNTSQSGTSDNGDRVAEHAITTINKVFVHYPRGTP